MPILGIKSSVKSHQSRKNNDKSVLHLYTVKKVSKRKGSDFLVRHVYYYAVMLITLVMMIGGMIAAAVNVVSLVNPTPYYMSFEDYKQNQHYEDEGEKEREHLSEEQLLANYERYQTEEVERDRVHTVNQLLYSGFWVFIPLPFFVLARRQLKRQEKD